MGSETNQSLFEFYQDGGKYQYNIQEKILASIFTAFSNLFILPTIIMLWDREMMFEFFIGFITMFTSFMYHFQDSVGIHRILLTELQWHKLDNIASINCFISLIIYQANFQNKRIQQSLQFSSFFLVIILQECDPWNLAYTIFPIIGYTLLVIFMKIKMDEKSPKTQFYNKKMAKKGFAILFLTVLCFIKGLDEFNDYLRFYHGLWHVGNGLSSMYTWQQHSEQSEEYDFTMVYDICFQKTQNIKEI